MATKKVTKTTAKTKEKKKLEIPAPTIKKYKITLHGTSPLLVNNFSEKSRQEIEDKYQKKAKAKAVPLTPKAQFENALYKVPGKRNMYGIPAAGIKKCAVAACRYVEGMQMTKTLGAFHVVGDIEGLIPIKGPAPVMDQRLVRVGNFGNKKPATRYRPRFDKWEVTFDVMLNEGVISSEQLINLYDTAGFSVGLCEYRPEKAGNLGMFEVKRA